MRAHVPAQVAAVLEDLAAGAALVHPPVLPQLPHQLPPDAVPSGENQTPLEGDAAALMMRKPARWMVNRKTGGRLSSRGGKSSRLQSSWKGSFQIVPARWEKGAKLGITQSQGHQKETRHPSYCVCLWPPGMSHATCASTRAAGSLQLSSRVRPLLSYILPDPDF